MKKKYKLIKKLPFENSPEIGYISEVKKDGLHYWNHNWFNPKDYPEYWKEIKEEFTELIRNSSRYSLIGKSHTKISIQFAIEVLEECNKLPYLHRGKYLRDKIQELKQYLDEK